jgi:hypothetical protein
VLWMIATHALPQNWKKEKKKKRNPKSSAKIG